MEGVLGKQDEERSEGGWRNGGGGVLKKGPWTAAEDAILMAYVQKHGEGNWNSLQKHSGLSRCGKSCRLRWANHLRPNLKKGAFTLEEERLIIELHAKLGNKWARIAAQLPGRTDNEIKNYWNTRIKRRKRAGLPIYPPEVQTMHLPPPYLHSHNGDTTRTTLNKDSDRDIALQSPRAHIPTLNYETNGLGLSVVLCDTALSELPNNGLIMSSPSMGETLNPIQGFSPTSEGQCYSTEYEPRPILQLSDTMTNSFELEHPKSHCNAALDSMAAQGLPLEPDPGIERQSSEAQDNYHGFATGSFSGFGLDSSPKLELPSAQYVEAAISAGTAMSALIAPFTPLYLSKSVPSETHSCEFVGNNGLLESLLQESEAKQWSRQMATRSSDIPSVQRPCHHILINKILPMDDSKGHVWSYTDNAAAQPVSSTQVHYWKNVPGSRPTSEPVIKVETSGAFSLACPDIKSSISQDFLKPNEMELLEWKSSSELHPLDTLAQVIKGEPLNDNFDSLGGFSAGQVGSGTVTSNQVWELGSCQWNNMPGACLMGDLAADCRAFVASTEQSVDTCAIF